VAVEGRWRHPCRAAGGARKAEARPVAAEDEPRISNPNLVIPCRKGEIGIAEWLYCIEASANIYESTRLGVEDTPGYIWQSKI
jgi:hypothetical protein